MKRKVCALRSFDCGEDDVMEELSVAGLARRKESAAPLTGEPRDIPLVPLGYPLALVLRLRVLQVVCGISAIVMGGVAIIEERQLFNMGLGLPAGGVSVLAAAVSIRTSRGWNSGGATLASILWLGAACLLLALIAQSCRTIIDPPVFGSPDIEDSGRPSPKDLIVIALVQMALSLSTLISAGLCAKIDFGT